MVRSWEHSFYPQDSPLSVAGQVSPSTRCTDLCSSSPCHCPSGTIPELPCSAFAACLSLIPISASWLKVTHDGTDLFPRACAFPLLAPIYKCRILFLSLGWACKSHLPPPSKNLGQVLTPAVRGYCPRRPYGGSVQDTYAGFFSSSACLSAVGSI